jgi:hypothetical protein
MKKWAPKSPYTGLVGAGFSDVMTLYYVLDQLGFDGSTKAGITDALKTTQDGHLFMGEPYTCGSISIMPAICQTSVRIYQYENGKLIDPTKGKWVDGIGLLPGV